jgi:hypothetical protein
MACLHSPFTTGYEGMKQHMIDLNSFFLTYRREDVKAHFFKGGMKRLYFFNHSFLLDFVGTTDTINV